MKTKKDSINHCLCHHFFRLYHFTVRLSRQKKKNGIEESIYHFSKNFIESEKIVALQHSGEHQKTSEIKRKTCTTSSVEHAQMKTKQNYKEKRIPA